jgi:hypothetical protein
MKEEFNKDIEILKEKKKNPNWNPGVEKLNNQIINNQIKIIKALIME